ncbi:regulator [Enterobacter kobei]|uniref:regulator n=1 Tax=Enterobacter kobei TaxID=208224 RepID=UPI002FCFD53B
MRPNITIVIPEPYLPLDEYCRRTGTARGTALNLIEYGKLPIKPKGKQTKGLIEVNMAALTVRALSECDISLNA